jgi:hypothetical protein
VTRPSLVVLSLALFVPACVEVAVDRAPAPGKGASRAGAEAKREPSVREPSVREPSVPEPAARPVAPAPVPDAPRAAAQFEVREPVTPAPASFELLDAGAEPRAAIVLGAKQGDRMVVRIGLALQVAMKLGTNDVPKTTLPPLEVGVSAEVMKVGDAIEVELRVVDVRIDDAAVASERVKSAVEATVEALRTSTGSLVLARDGRVQSISMSSGHDAIESKAAGLDHALVELLPAFPTEPVGVGARWKLVQPVVRGGVTLQRTSEFRLVANRDGRLELEVDATHVAVTGGDASTGATRIDAQSGVARGRIVVVPRDVLPTTAEITAHTTTRASFGGAAEGVLVAIDLATSLARADTGR